MGLHTSAGRSHLLRWVTWIHTGNGPKYIYTHTHAPADTQAHAYANALARIRTDEQAYRNILKYPHAHIFPYTCTLTHARTHAHMPNNTHTHNYTTCLINGYCLLHRAIFTIKEDTHFTKYQHNIKKMLRGNPL